MKNRSWIFILSVIACLAAHNSRAEFIVEEWPILEKQKGSYINAMIWVDYSKLGTELDLTKKASVGSIESTLASYYAYAYAKKNDKSKVPGLYYAHDGSQRRLLETLVDIPDKFSLYNDIDSVVLGRIFRWGNYTIVDLVLNYGGIENRWVGTLVCDEFCYLTDAFYRGGESISLMPSRVLPT